MTIKDTDLFLVSKNGTNYKITALDLKIGTKDYDYLLVSRDGINYKFSKQYLKSPDFSSNIFKFDNDIIRFNSIILKLLPSDIYLSIEILITTKLQDYLLFLIIFLEQGLLIVH